MQLKEDRKREDHRRLKEDMKRRLDLQLQEKKAKEHSEKLVNEDYHRVAKLKAEQEELVEKTKEEARAKKKEEFKNNLLLQMGHLNSGGGMVGYINGGSSSAMSPS